MRRFALFVMLCATLLCPRGVAAQTQTPGGTSTMTVRQGPAGTSPWKIDFTGASVTIGGTVAVTQSTSPWVISFTAPQHVIVDSSSSVGVTGTFWQATQPVSIASMPSTPVTGTFWQATQPVSGTFWQATQPVSIASMPSTPVTGTFWQATQPSSVADGADTTLGAKADTKSTATDATPISAISILKQISASVQAPPSQAVTGTFWQATQPVSIASMPSTPVTGTFWQATQPISAASGSFVSGAIADGAEVTLGAKADAKSTATDATPITVMQVLKQISASVQAPPSQAVTGTFWQATQPISGTVTANAGTGTLAVSIAGSNPCANPSAALLGLAGATSGTSAVQLVALSGSTKIYVCSVVVTGVSGTSPTFSLKYGTGSACATGGVTVFGPITTTTLTAYNAGPVPLVTPAGQALCYLDGGTSPVQNYSITYVQQ